MPRGPEPEWQLRYKPAAAQVLQLMRPVARMRRQAGNRQGKTQAHVSYYTPRIG